MWWCYTTFKHFHSRLDYIEKNCNNLSIRTPLFKLQFSKKSIFDHGIKIWNNLSPEVKFITHKSIFKKIIRKKLINETTMVSNNKGCFPLIALLCYTKHDVQRQYRQFA